MFTKRRLSTQVNSIGTKSAGMRACVTKVEILIRYFGGKFKSAVSLHFAQTWSCGIQTTK